MRDENARRAASLVAHLMPNHTAARAGGAQATSATATSSARAATPSQPARPAHQEHKVKTTTISVEDLDIGNIGGPDFRKDFQKALDELYQAFMADEDYGGDRMSAKLVCTFGVKFNAETQAAEISASVRTTLPKRRARTTFARARSGRFLVDSDLTGGRQGQLVDFDHRTGAPRVVTHAGDAGTAQD